MDGSGIAQALVRNVHETTVAPVFAIGAAAVAAEDDASSEFESRNKSKNMSSFKSRIKKSFGNRRPFRPRIYRFVIKEYVQGFKGQILSCMTHSTFL